MDNLLNLLFPPKCVICGNHGSLFCAACLSKCRYLRRYYTLAHPKKETCPLDVFCYFVYERKIRDCIRRAKYSRKQFAALREVTKFAVEDMLARGVKISADCVISIPLSPKKQKTRGFNQAEVIAKVISKAYAISYQNSILTRIKDTTAQHRLNEQERLKNMQGAFGVRFPVRGYSFLLVDDICTTGSTLLEAARALYEAGASQVTAFTLSKRL